MKPTDILVPVVVYKSMLRAERQLDALERHGVTDWEGYEAAMNDFNLEEKKNVK